MADLRLSLSVGSYDRTLPLMCGLVKPEGIELALPPLQWGAGMGSPEADVYELPLPAMIIQRARRDTHVGLAIFPKRTFFQQLVLTRQDRPIEQFEDFRGKNVGLLNWYQHAMGVWTRGHLDDAYGIKPEEMRWFTQRPTLFPLAENQPVSITILEAERSQVQMLLDGELDVLIHEQAHRFLKEAPGLRRAFPDYREREANYFNNGGGFPINHTLFIRREIIEANPWVASSLRRAFEESKRMAYEVMSRNNATVSSPWMDGLLEDQENRMAADLFPYGLETNRATLETFVRYLHTQGFIPQRLALEEIFAPDDI